MKNKKRLVIFLFIELVVCLLLAFFKKGDSGRAYASLIEFPLAQLGSILRSLSLSSQLGNIAAIILYISIGFLPLAYLAYRHYRKKKGLEDILLPILSLLLFMILYLMINPSLINRWFGPLTFPGVSLAGMGKSNLGGVFYSALAAYLILKAIRNIEQRDTDKLLDILAYLFYIAMAIGIFSVFYLGVGTLAMDIQALKDANTDPAIWLSPSYLFMILAFILENTPTLLLIYIFIVAIRLVEALRVDRYSDEVIASSKKVFRLSKFALLFIMVGNLAFNLLQVICSKYLYNVAYKTLVPLNLLGLSLLMLLVGRYFSQSKQLHTDNQLFI
ncbi:MAG: hypothetical protein WCS08_07980 [Eubacteriales bacterium]